MTATIADLVNQFFADLDAEPQEDLLKALNAWLWFTCPASLRGEVRPAILADERWQ